MPMSTKMPISPTATRTGGFSGCTAAGAGALVAPVAGAAPAPPLVDGATGALAAPVPAGALPAGLLGAAPGPQAASTTSRAQTPPDHQRPCHRRTIVPPPARLRAANPAPSGHSILLATRTG